MYSHSGEKQEGLAVASIARDDPPLFPACTATTMRLHALRARMRAQCGLRPQCGKFGSEFGQYDAAVYVQSASIRATNVFIGVDVKPLRE